MKAKQKEEESKVGSGNNWTGKRTIPKEPKLTARGKQSDEKVNPRKPPPKANIDLFDMSPGDQSYNVQDSDEKDTAPYNKFVESPGKSDQPQGDFKDCMAYLHDQIQQLEF